jgi:hypothetical protein
MCLVLGLNCVSDVARTMQALLSSNILEGGRIGEWMLSPVLSCQREMKLRV